MLGDVPANSTHGQERLGIQTIERDIDRAELVGADQASFSAPLWLWWLQVK